MNAKEQFNQVLDNTLADIKDTFTVTTPVDLGVEWLLHISDNPKIDKFTPTVPPRAVPTQDHRLPRVCTSTCLVGCIIGYNGIAQDLLHRTWDDETFLGGYVIYGFKPEICVTPSLKILTDQEMTDEQWLVSYSPETTHYVPTMLGKIFLKAINISAHKTDDEESKTGKKIEYDYEIYIEVFEGYTVPWIKSDRLNAGFYKVETHALMATQNCAEPNPYTLVAVDRATYLANKNATAGLLNYVEQSPSLKW